MNESRGKSVSEKTYKKVKAMDKWVYYEILEMMDENENEEEEIPYSADEVIEELEEEIEEIDEEEEEDDDDDDNEEEEQDDDDETDFNEAPSGDPIKGQTIDADFKIAYDNGKTQITLEELKNVSKTAYNVIFENYDDSGDNGIVTTNYTLLETDSYAEFLHWKNDNDILNAISKNQRDGWFIHGSTTDGGLYRDDINVFNSNQIKLADGTNTTFDGTNPDIRYKEGGNLGHWNYTIGGL